MGKVADRAYEIRCKGYPNDGDNVIGWNDTEDGAKGMCRAIILAPGAYQATVVRDPGGQGEFIFTLHRRIDDRLSVLNGLDVVIYEVDQKGSNAFYEIVNTARQHDIAQMTRDAFMKMCQALIVVAQPRTFPPQAQRGTLIPTDSPALRSQKLGRIERTFGDHGKPIRCDGCLATFEADPLTCPGCGGMSFTHIDDMRP